MRLIVRVLGLTFLDVDWTETTTPDPERPPGSSTLVGESFEVEASTTMGFTLPSTSEEIVPWNE